MSADSDREEIGRFVDSLPLHFTFAEMAEACALEFGAAAWSADEIERRWTGAHPVRTERSSRFWDDPEIRAVIEKLADRVKLDEIAGAIERRVGVLNAPSRSQVHRLIVRYRASRPRPAAGRADLKTRLKRPVTEVFDEA